MIAELRAVEPHARVPVDGIEAEDHPLPLPPLRHGDRAPVPEKLLLRNALPHPRQRRLRREGDEDVSIPFLGRLAIGRRRADLAGGPIDDCVFPQAVEIEPRLPHQLRPGVFAPGVVGGDLFPPSGHEGRRSGLPFSRRSGQQREAGERKQGGEQTTGHGSFPQTTKCFPSETMPVKRF